MKTLLSIILYIGRDLLHIHKYAKDILHGSVQFTIVLYVFSAVIYLIAPYTADYMRSLLYFQSAIEIAPVVLAGGTVSALLCDLVMRKSAPEKAEKDNTDEDKDK